MKNITSVQDLFLLETSWIIFQILKNIVTMRSSFTAEVAKEVQWQAKY